MDYNYIKCLIERYFQCETTLEEELILQDFFMQQQLPEELQQYKSLFTTLQAEAEIELPEDFDQKVQTRIQELEAKTPAAIFKTRLGNFNRSLSPFYKAVASIALIITVGVASNRYWAASNSQEPAVYNYSSYQDTYDNPKEACNQVVGALKDLSSAFKGQAEIDTAAVGNTETQIIN